MELGVINKKLGSLISKACDDIINLNNLKNKSIYPGQIIQISI